MAHGSIGLNQQMAENKRTALKKAKAIKSAELSAYLSYIEDYEEDYGQPPIDYAQAETANPHLEEK